MLLLTQVNFASALGLPAHKSHYYRIYFRLCHTHTHLPSPDKLFQVVSFMYVLVKLYPHTTASTTSDLGVERKKSLSLQKAEVSQLICMCKGAWVGIQHNIIKKYLPIVHTKRFLTELHIEAPGSSTYEAVYIKHMYNYYRDRTVLLAPTATWAQYCNTSAVLQLQALSVNQQVSAKSCLAE